MCRTVEMRVLKDLYLQGALEALSFREIVDGRALTELVIFPITEEFFQIRCG